LNNDHLECWGKYGDDDIKMDIRDADNENAK
jgi:hypothetical protein